MPCIGTYAVCTTGFHVILFFPLKKKPHVSHEVFRRPRIPAHVAQDVLTDRDGLQVVLVAPFQVAGEKLERQSLRILAIAVPSTLPVTSFTLAVLVALVGGLLFGIGGQRSRPASQNRVAMQSSSNARSAASLVDRICSGRST